MINEKLITEAVNRLVNKFHPNKIILFGSYARGTTDIHSDADILVICPVSDNRRPLMVEMDRTLYGLC